MRLPTRTWHIKCFFFLAVTSEKRVSELHIRSFDICHPKRWRSCFLSLVPELLAKTQNPSILESQFEGFTILPLPSFLGDLTLERQVVCRRTMKRLLINQQKSSCFYLVSALVHFLFFLFEACMIENECSEGIETFFFLFSIFFPDGNIGSTYTHRLKVKQNTPSSTSLSTLLCIYQLNHKKEPSTFAAFCVQDIAHKSRYTFFEQPCKDQ